MASVRSAPPPPIKLPLINLSQEALSHPESRQKEVKKLVDAFTDVGFCLITGYGGYSEETLLKWLKWFTYEVPKETKIDQLATKAFKESNKNTYRGFFPEDEGSLSYKQGYDIGPDVPDDKIQIGNPFRERTPELVIEDKAEEVKEFYKVMRSHYKLMEKNAYLMLELIAEAGAEGPDFFDHMFQEVPGHTLRPLFYPKRKDNIPQGAYLPDGRLISTPPHQDSGILTLLQTFDYPGLEIELDGQWHSVPPTPDTVVVNVGEQLAAMSNRRFKATIHRVIDIEKDRFSLPFFQDPCYNANVNSKIPVSLLPAGSEGKSPEETEFYPFGAFLFHKLPIYFEYKGICDNLPGWMKKEYLDAYKPKKFWALERILSGDSHVVDGENHIEKKKMAIEN